MLVARQSTAVIVTVGPVLDADGVAVTNGVVGDFKISKNGGAPAALDASATLTHRHTGFYSLSLTATDVNTVGTAEVTIDDTVNACPLKEIQVIEEAVYDALFAASAAGYQIPIWSSAGATVSLSATTVATVTTTATATNVTTVNGLAANVITAAAIANGAIDAATFAADVDAEILSYLVDDATRIDASALNTLSGHDPGATLGTSTLTQTQVTGGAYSVQSASCVLGDARIANLDATISSRGTSTLTQTQVTGGAYSIQSASCVLGDARIANLDATISSRGTSTLTQTQVTGGAYTIQSASCVLGDARIANLDATISSRQVSIWAAANSTVNLSATTIKTATDVETDTQDIQSRLPAALGANGNMKSDVRDWLNTAAATPDVAGYPKVTQKAGTGTGELDYTEIAEACATGVFGAALGDYVEEGTFGLLWNAGVVRLKTYGNDGTTGTAILDSGASSNDNAYTNRRLFNYATSEWAYITAYTGSTKTATFTPSFSSATATAGKFLIADPESWNPDWDTEVQSEANDALVANNLDHLAAVAAVAGDVVNSSILARLSSKSATPAFSSFDNTTDSLEAIRDRGDTAWGAGAVPSVEDIDAELSANHGFGSWESGGTGSGARSVTATVDDGSDELESARVRFTKGAESYVGSTNASGVVTFSLDDGTWTVAITLAGYTFTPTTLVVNGNETPPPYSMTAVSVTASEPGLTTGVLTAYSKFGLIEAGARLYISVTAPMSDEGFALDAEERVVTAGVDGTVQITNMFGGVTYSIRRGPASMFNRRLAVSVTIPDAPEATTLLDSLIGAD